MDSPSEPVCTAKINKVTSNCANKPKRVIFIRGSNSNQLTNIFMKDFSRLKLPYSVFLSEKFNIKPFEDATQIEALAQENDCTLFMFASHNKKRPNNIVIGRLADDSTIKEMIEMGISNFKSMRDFQGYKLPHGSKLNLNFTGSIFQECSQFKLFESLFNDFFLGHTCNSEKLSKVEYCVKVMSLTESARFETSRVVIKSRSHKMCKIELEDMGPNFDVIIKRVKLFASESIMDTTDMTDPICVISRQPSPVDELINVSIDPESNLLNTSDLKPETCNGPFAKDELKDERGVKRAHEDIDEILKRMKFIDEN